MIRSLRKTFILMPSILPLFLLTAIKLAPVHGQESSVSDLNANFSALIVQDLDSVAQWYVTLFGFKLVDKKEHPKIGLKQANLRAGDNHLELIELATAINPDALVAADVRKPRFVGYFKYGFTVPNFDAWLSKLEKHGVQTQGQVVTNDLTQRRMIVFRDPEGNRIQLFER